eukprot:1628642-Rhodomonas_salina.3
MQAFCALAEPKALLHDNNASQAGVFRQCTEDEALLSLVECIQKDHRAMSRTALTALRTHLSTPTDTRPASSATRNAHCATQMRRRTMMMTMSTQPSYLLLVPG